MVFFLGEREARHQCEQQSSVASWWGWWRWGSARGRVQRHGSRRQRRSAEDIPLASCRLFGNVYIVAFCRRRIGLPTACDGGKKPAANRPHARPARSVLQSHPRRHVQSTARCATLQKDPSGIASAGPAAATSTTLPVARGSMRSQAGTTATTCRTAATAT